MNISKIKKSLFTIGLVGLVTLSLSGCSPSSEPDENILKLWHYEGAQSAMAIAWNEAIEIFEKETGAKVEFEEKGFEQIRSSASQVLNSNQAPDILEYNKGNATAGLLASQGLLSNLDEMVKENRIEEKLPLSLQTTARYNEKGMMGEGSWYGVPNYGEFVGVYYNESFFKEHNIAIPETFNQFEQALEQFKAKNITPLAESASEYPLGQLWYQLALTKADQSWVDDYQLYNNPVDWQGPEITFATETVKNWVDKGYISKDVTGMKAEDAGSAFIAGKYPIFFSGTWWHNRFSDEITDFEWNDYLFPDTKYSPGSAGNMWVVPEKAKNKELAYKFIEITMRPEIQALIGNNGGVPVAATITDITDGRSKQLIQNFNTLSDRGGLAFYPDWPTPTFYDELNAGLQELVNGTKTPEQTQKQWEENYKKGVEQVEN